MCINLKMTKMEKNNFLERDLTKGTDDFYIFSHSLISRHITDI